jgi:hypothetical protein
MMHQPVAVNITAGTSSDTPMPAGRKGKRKLPHGVDTSAEGRSEQSAESQSSQDSGVSGNGETEVAPNHPEVSPSTAKFARSSAKQLSKAQGRIRELAEQNAELLRQLELLRRIPKKVPLPMLDSEILSDDDNNGRSERSGSFDGVVDPADKRENGSPFNPKGSGETPGSGEAMVVAGQTVISFDSRHAKPLNSAQFSHAEVQGFIQELENTYRAGRWTNETLIRMTSQASALALQVELTNARLVSRDKPEEWLSWPAQEVIAKLRVCYPTHQEVRFVTPKDFWLKKAKSFRPEVVRHASDASGPTHALRVHMLQPLMQALADQGEPPLDVRVSVIDELVKSFTGAANDHKTKPGNIRFKDCLFALVEAKKSSTSNTIRVYDFIVLMGDAMREVEQVHQDAVNMGLTMSRDNKPKGSGEQQPKGSSSASQQPQVQTCKGCGADRHAVTNCPFKSHPDYNKEGAWVDSAAYKLLKARFPLKKGGYRLSPTLRADGTPLETPIEVPKDSKGLKDKRHKSKSGEYLDALCAVATANQGSNNAPMVDTMLRQCVISTNATNCLTVDVMWDTGAYPHNFISEEVAAWIDAEDGKRPSDCFLDAGERNVVTAVNLAGCSDMHVVSTTVRSFNLLFLNEVKKTVELLPCLHARVIKTSFDVIIGLDTIRKANMILKIPRYFSVDETVEKLLLPHSGCTSCTPPGPNWLGTSHRPSGDISCETCSRPSGTIKCGTSSRPSGDINCETGCRPSGDQIRENLSELDCEQSPVNSTHVHPPEMDSAVVLTSAMGKTRLEETGSWFQVPVENFQSTTLAALRLREEVLDAVDDNDEIEWKENPFECKDASSNDSDVLELIQIDGPPSLQRKLRALCAEYRDVFATSVRDEPADIPAMTIKVDETKWKSTKHRLPPRSHSVEKQTQIREQCDKLLALGVIRHSTASEWSQVHMVPKPNPGEWRFTLDFVRLNACTDELEGWPITLIRPLFQRLGARKPRFFGVMDLTSGYHQAPLDAGSQAYTAFITIFGLFEWTRVPMGTKGSGPYFQRVIATQVLSGLIYHICELYIDDVLIDGPDEDTYVSNVRQVFERFRKHRVAVNPRKTKLGLEKVEYVGHLVSPKGISFTKEKRLKVQDYVRPRTHREMLMYIGLVNYFHDHVRDMTEIIRPLRRMVDRYEKSKRLEWTPELVNVFEDSKGKIADCQQLFFMDENAPVTLQTDACEHGIGGYLYQTVNGKIQVIMCVSKALTGAQLNWNMREKECYAIFYNFKVLEDLLKHVHFHLKTDHKNLVYINCALTGKVARWKLFMQDWNFSISWVEGQEEHQQVPDKLSRLYHTEPNGTSAVDSPQAMLSVAMKEVEINDVELAVLGLQHNALRSNGETSESLGRLVPGSRVKGEDLYSTMSLLPIIESDQTVN